jgi:hypothetical protein
MRDTRARRIEAKEDVLAALIPPNHAMAQLRSHAESEPLTYVSGLRGRAKPWLLHTPSRAPHAPADGEATVTLS